MKVGLDIGYSSVKVAYGTARQPEMMKLPVGAAPVSRCGMSIDGGVALGGGHLVTIKGEPWVAGIEPARLSGFEATMDESYPTTDEYRALFYAALSAIGEKTIDGLVTGLPVAHFQDLALRNGLAKLMEGRHYVREDLVVDVKKVMVVPQPAGAFGAYTRDSTAGRGDARIGPGSSVLVVDPGHYSLDWVIYNGSFDLKSSGSTSSAGEEVIRKAAQLLTERNGIRVRQAKLQDAVLSSAIPLVIGSKTVEFWPALQEVAGDIVNDNLKALRGTLRSVADKRGIDLVLLTGGGAALFKDALKSAFPESTVVCVRDSVTANARGFYAYCDTALKAAA